VSIQPDKSVQRAAGKVAFVTGSASGIGRATALLLARHGASVICADIDLVGARVTVGNIQQAGGVASEMKLDVTFEADWKEAIDESLARHARLDVLVNCAGISFAAPVTEMSLEDWRRVMAINLEGVFLGTKNALLVMRQTGDGGSIVNVASASGIKPAAGASAYSTSKAAVCMFTKVVAKECVERGDPIRVNSVCPSGVQTPMWRAMPFFKELVVQTGSEEAAFQSMSQTLLHLRQRRSRPADQGGV
jgi:3(or 17)beta-hydroxysteroid dehydrogenase